MDESKTEKYILVTVRVPVDKYGSYQVEEHDVKMKEDIRYESGALCITNRNDDLFIYAPGTWSRVSILSSYHR